MSKMNKIARIVAKNFSIPLLSIGMLAAMPTSSPAVTLTVNGFTCTVRVTRSISIFGYPIYSVTYDPENVQAFKYNALFNPQELAFEGIEYAGSYTQTTLPDLSQLSFGLIQGIAGSASTPVAGNADLFSVLFRPLVDNPQSIVTYSPGPEGFIITRDPETGTTTTLDPSECPTCSAPVPEPITVFGSVMGLGFGAVLKKEYSRRQKKAKTLEKLEA